MSDDEPEDDDDEGVPFVVLGRVAEVAAFMPADIGKKFADRPIWFLLEDDAELVGLFDRIPEDPMSKGQVAAILGGLRAFAEARAEELQSLLGPTDGIGLGFHADATLAKVAESFEEDGFVIVGAIQGGEVVETDDEPEP